MKSSKPLAKAMKRWLIYDVIPSILRKGEYSIIPAPIAQSTIPTLVIAEPCPRMTICHNPKGFPVSSVKSAIYILNLPFLNMYKFGYSNNLVNRLKQHEYDFGKLLLNLLEKCQRYKRLRNDLKQIYVPMV